MAVLPHQSHLPFIVLHCDSEAPLSLVADYSPSVPSVVVNKYPPPNDEGCDNIANGQPRGGANGNQTKRAIGVLFDVELQEGTPMAPQVEDAIPKFLLSELVGGHIVSIVQGGTCDGCTTNEPCYNVVASSESLVEKLQLANPFVQITARSLDMFDGDASSIPPREERSQVPTPAPTIAPAIGEPNPTEAPTAMTTTTPTKASIPGDTPSPACPDVSLNFVNQKFSKKEGGADSDTTYILSCTGDDNSDAVLLGRQGDSCDVECLGVLEFSALQSLCSQTAGSIDVALPG
ncbi:unnamed protein product [Cylindrotheca closterium]|uniref:Uncharacterized protein n=1 Tax=Cylindrotheca closterium TaxID=2856 RepID=A0AAD2PVV2_9STRA|nr:unnamed protein product [Cylindrotheca closterium]